LEAYEQKIGVTGSAAVRLVVAGVTQFGARSTTAAAGTRVRDRFGKAVQGSQVGCDYCKTMPLQQQLDRKHRYMPLNITAGTVTAGCPFFETDAAIRRRDTLATQKATKKCRTGMLAGHTQNRYFFPSNIAAPKYEVCRKFATHVLPVGKQFLKNGVASMMSTTVGGLLPKPDNRGAVARKLAVEKRQTNLRYVTDTIKRLPRTTSHFSSAQQHTAKYLLDTNLNFTRLWFMTIERVSPEFFSQAQRLKFYATLDDGNRPPPSGVKLLKPAISYNTHTNICKTEIVVAFGKPAVDHCDVCTGFRRQSDCAQNAIQYDRIADAWNEHKVTADASYHVVEEDAKACRESWRKHTEKNKDRAAACCNV
jgi:hypothetical protein